jgi:hypothetical protein
VVVLLDAAEAAGLIAEPELLRRWSELKARSSPSDDFVAEAVPLWELLCAVMRQPDSHGHWIERRWREVEARLLAANGLRRGRGVK